VQYRERGNQAKANRRLDKKVKESQMLIEDERRNAEQYKDQVSYWLTHSQLLLIDHLCRESLYFTMCVKMQVTRDF